MMMIITCTQCHKDGELPFKLNWEYEHEFCNKCRHNEIKAKRYYFCSAKCLKAWVKKFSGHNHNWVPVGITGDSYVMLVDIKKDIVKIEEKCSICERSRQREIIEPERQIYKKQIKEMMDGFKNEG